MIESSLVSVRVDALLGIHELQNYLSFSGWACFTLGESEIYHPRRAFAGWRGNRRQFTNRDASKASDDHTGDGRRRAHESSSHPW